MERVNGGEDPDPSGYYFRTAPGFEAPDGEYEWLNKLVAFAVGRRRDRRDLRRLRPLLGSTDGAAGGCAVGAP